MEKSEVYTDLGCIDEYGICISAIPELCVMRSIKNKERVIIETL